MNTHTDYRRHMHHPTPEPTRPAGALENHLAVSRDPSLSSTAPALTTASRKHVAWVRPTELHTFASPLIGRGIDLQTELTRRAQQGPRRAVRAARRLTPAQLAPASDSPPHEGISL